MPRGPRMIDNNKGFTTRDSLGIEGVVTSMQGEICPIVNTVTPRAYYWPFMVWGYYDFHKYSGIKEKNKDTFDEYLRRQDYYFVLATLLTNNDETNLVGKQKTQEDIKNNQTGPYPYNSKYFITRYGGMQYYNAGCLSMYFITQEDQESGKEYKFPVLTQYGEEMAKAFEAVIKDTDYYKYYRIHEQLVPKSVLEEYGEVINLGLKGFDECKTILTRYMFRDDRNGKISVRSQRLDDCAKYIQYFVRECGVELSNSCVCRQLFYDYQLPVGTKVDIPDELKLVSKKWEIVIGRMYFVIGLEMIWRYMLIELCQPMSKRKWIDFTLSKSDFRWNVIDKLGNILGECVYDFAHRENMVAQTAKRMPSSYSIENGLKLMFSVYNRFKNREDFGDEKAFFDYGADGRSISLNEFFEKVEEYKSKTIEEFLRFIMNEWIIEQHCVTAFDKMIQGRDGFYFEIIDDKYIHKHTIDIGFQGIRMVQLMQVMKDLDML